MNTIFPNYYKKFKCIADKCRHSCCIGWEIDIDSDTLKYYSTIKGAFAERLKSSISYAEEPHFILQNDDRCPFLNESGLCDMILELGEDSLCDICADHPRFRNFYSGAIEMGLGLCCEAAAELILKSDEPFSLENFDLNDNSYTDEEKFFLALRSDLIDIMKDRSLSIKKRHSKLLKRIDYILPDKSVADWCDIYLTLERLDPLWTDILTKLKNAPVDSFYKNSNKIDKIALEQLTIYFIYRHISGNISIDEFKKLTCFSIISTQLIMALSSIIQGDDIIGYSRMYSSEIEYSDINIEVLCGHF